MRLRNTNPLGDVDLPLLGRVVAAGEEFEVDDEQGKALLEQVGNYEPTDADDLNAMKVDDLKQYAAEHDIDVSGASKKDELIAAISAHVTTGK